ncbi:peptidoglycan-binding protein [Streptomyces sp. NPDC127038]|uniref:peptidoglycan-binding domain-containing protein n=1 Tax=Streptomyces sp. NPDC127038 TaxID=3347114 RepID=UPI00366985FF
MAGAAVLGVAGGASADPGVGNIGSGYTTSGAGVWCVQHNLNYIISHQSGNPPYRNLSEDSTWGPQTAADVRWYQASVNLQADGVVGQQTGTSLILNGDKYYNGDTWNGPGYCYYKMPGTITG